MGFAVYAPPRWYGLSMVEDARVVVHHHVVPTGPVRLQTERLHRHRAE